MKRIIDFDSEKDFEMLKIITQKLTDCKIVGTLKQVIAKGDNEYDFISINQKVLNGHPVYKVNDTYFYLMVDRMKIDEISQLKLMYNNMLERGTVKFKEGKVNDYVYTIDVAKEELDKSKGYIMSFIQPVFMEATNDTITFVFQTQDVRCGIEEVSSYDIEAEEMERKESDNEVYKNLTTESYKEQENQEEQTKPEKDSEFNEYTNVDNFLNIDNE